MSARSFSATQLERSKRAVNAHDLGVVDLLVRGLASGGATKAWPPHPGQVHVEEVVPAAIRVAEVRPQLPEG